MAFEYPQELIDDYEKLLEVDEGHDVIIYAGEDENAKEIHAHSLILCIRSQYFRAAFSNEWADKKDGKFILKKQNISPQIFEFILRFIYCGKIDLTKLQDLELLELLMAVDELNIQTLIPCIQEYLINYQYEFLQRNPIEILETVYQVYQIDTFSGLWEFLLEIICYKPEILFNSDNLIRLSAPLLELLLKRNDLLLDEIIIWDNLVKWSFAQHHPSIQQDVNKWNKEEIVIMKNTFHMFIPLIRFYLISSEDFYLKVYPYKVLLPEDLINNILAFHTEQNKEFNNYVQPSRSPKYDTNLIKPHYFAIFSSWIEKKDDSHYNYYNSRDIPYYFCLIYRASRDGNTAEAFHEKCDSKGATIVVIKIKDSEQIIGGYNPFSWDLYNHYKRSTNSFIFSFKDGRDTKTAKVGYSNGLSSVGCYRSHGPIFGYYLYFLNNTWIINHSYSRNYPGIKFPMNGSINIEDYEVFQIIKKS